MLAKLGVVGDGHLQFVARIAHDVADDGALVVVEISPDKRYVFPSCRLVEELTSEIGLGYRGLRHYKQPGRVLVDPMHEPEPGVIDVVVGIVFEMPCEGVDESLGIVAMPGMNPRVPLNLLTTRTASSS